MMKLKKVPMRMCVVTREKVEKKDLIRIVRTPEGEVKIDTTGRMNGRGVYLKKDITIFEKAKKSKVLDRTLEVPVPQNIYEELIQLIN